MSEADEESDKNKDIHSDRPEFQDRHTLCHRSSDSDQSRIHGDEGGQNGRPVENPQERSDDQADCDHCDIAAREAEVCPNRVSSHQDRTCDEADPF